MLLIHSKGKQFAPAVTKNCSLETESRGRSYRDFHLERRHPCLLSFVKSYSRFTIQSPQSLIHASNGKFRVQAEIVMLMRPVATASRYSISSLQIEHTILPLLDSPRYSATHSRNASDFGCNDQTVPAARTLPFVSALGCIHWQYMTSTNVLSDSTPTPAGLYTKCARDSA